MIAVDTNILVRMLVSDDAAQTRKVRAFFERLERTSTQAYVSNIVVCEMAWVLESCYGFDRHEISLALDDVCSARQLEFQNRDVVIRALSAYRQGKGDLADYLIREDARSSGCQ